MEESIRGVRNIRVHGKRDRREKREKVMSDKQLNTYEENLNDNFLIEAGAGTGKTYSIQVLYWRKLLSGVPVDKILVVTFTNLATSELRSRLRTILQNAVAIADG